MANKKNNFKEKKKIVFFGVEEWEEGFFKGAFKKLNAEVILVHENLDNENVKKYSDADVISVFIYSKIDKKILAEMKNLKMICTRSVGFDHIDLKECRKRKIVVSNAPEYAEETVAEHTFALLLALSRKIVQAAERTKKGNFDVDNLKGFDLNGKVIGIVGLGRIGSRVVKIAKGFGMKVIAFDKHKKHKNVKNTGFDFLLRNSDIISLHVPYVKETHHLINKNNIGKIKKGAVLLNTSRGGLIETEALIIALNQGILSGVGLDVLEEEPLIREENQILSRQFNKEALSTTLRNHMLLRSDNVIITPHSAFYSKESLIRSVNTSVENIKSFLNGKNINEVKVK